MATIDGNQKKLTVSGEAIEGAVNSKHEHINKTVLDKLSDNNGTLQYNGADITGGSATEYTLPTASETVLGGVKVDGTTITVNPDGIISATSTGSGITEEQAANVAKIPTIENNVTTNTNSISNLETRVTQVESNGISDEVINQKINDYVASNGVLTEGAVMPEHLNSSIFNGQEQLILSNQLGSWQVMKLIYDISGVASATEYNYKIKGSITLDSTMSTPIKMKSSKESSLNYDVQTAKATAGVQLDISKEFTDTNLFDAIAFVGENSGVNGKYNNIRLFINNKECPRINYTTTGGKVAVSTFGDKVATQEYVENYVTNSPIGEGLVTYSSLNGDLFGKKIVIEGTTQNYPAVAIKLSQTGLFLKGDFVVAMDITTKAIPTQIRFYGGQWAYGDKGYYPTEVTEIAPNRYIIKYVFNNNDYSAGFGTMALQNVQENCTLDGTIHNIQLTVDGIKYYIDNFSIPSNKVGTVTVSDSNGEIATKDYVLNLFKDSVSESAKPSMTLPFVNTIYTVANTSNNTDNFNAIPIYLDYLYDGSKADNRITFSLTGEEYKVIASDPTYETQPKAIINKKMTDSFNCKKYNVEDITYNKVSVKSSVANPDIFCLVIGDSVTAGAVTNQPYWAVAAEQFAREDADHGRSSNVHFLGNIQDWNKTTEYNGSNINTHACACGVSSWSLRMWLNEDNNGKPNGFCYTDGDGKKQFSILKWIERYRNYTDEGVAMSIEDDGIGTMITADNISKIKCCTPNVIVINSTHNDDPANIFTDHEAIINIIKTELPNCKIIIGSPMPLIGTWWKDKYEGKKWVQGNYSTPNHGWAPAYAPGRLHALRYWANYEKQHPNEEIYAFPQYVITPTIEGFENIGYDIGNGDKLKMMIKQNQMLDAHPSTFTHKVWGCELYAMLKYIFCKDITDIDSNVVNVTLNNTTANLTVRSNTTITGTPSNGTSSVTYTSSDTSIATVDSTGLVTAVSTGTCYIYAETATSIRPAVCKVTVTE